MPSAGGFRAACMPRPEQLVVVRMPLGCTVSRRTEPRIGSEGHRNRNLQRAWVRTVPSGGPVPSDLGCSLTTTRARGPVFMERYDVTGYRIPRIPKPRSRLARAGRLVSGGGGVGVICLGSNFRDGRGCTREPPARAASRLKWAFRVDMPTAVRHELRRYRKSLVGCSPCRAAARKTVQKSRGRECRDGLRPKD